ncbi:hypothetical protein J1605_010409 [Eschrichtius robustus]|uniref:Uncharacterized protein n=1 Tax=Eschrichtius robustus TaxID=9764 RepID=A0AB34GRJ9_ESCRO|nr:hypothetical protein J1605_010409 [Eschrichtius robustus]
MASSATWSFSMPHAVGQSPSLDPHKSICHGQQPPPDHSSPSACPSQHHLRPSWPGSSSPPPLPGLHPPHEPSPSNQPVALVSGPCKPGAPHA